MGQLFLAVSRPEPFFLGSRVQLSYENLRSAGDLHASLWPCRDGELWLCLQNISTLPFYCAQDSTCKWQQEMRAGVSV